MLLQDLDYALLDFPEVRAKFVTLAQQNLRVCMIASLGSYDCFVVYRYCTIIMREESTLLAIIFPVSFIEFSFCVHDLLIIWVMLFLCRRSKW